MELLKVVETGAVTDAMVQLGVGSWMSGIFPSRPDMAVFGRAIPVQFSIITPPREPIDQFDIVQMCGEGDVLVWNVPSDENICGENIMHFIANRKLGGLVIDGRTRDFNTINSMNVSQFTRGRAIAPAPRNLRATRESFNVPVTCGGIVVNPGDYVFGDNDGILVVAEKYIDDVLRQAKLNMEYEKRMEAALNTYSNAGQIHEVSRTKKLITG
jgi:regulator of RNase E activity RraA